MRLSFAAVALALIALCAAALADDRLEALGIRLGYFANASTAPQGPKFNRPEDALPDGFPGHGKNDIAEAWLIAPTLRYDHGVLGDAVEAGGLRAILSDGQTIEYLLDENSVFEDLMPRLADLDGDSRDEVIAVRSYLDAGAALAVFGVRDGRLELLAETSPIGQPHRWLNPVGAGDFDGDGKIEIAYVETPHIGGILRIVALRGGRLVEMAVAHGFSNHAIGSRELRLSAIVDLDDDGSDEVLIPADGRASLRIVRLVDGAAREVGRIGHGAPIVTEFAVVDRDGNGRPDIAYGLADGSLVVLSR